MRILRNLLLVLTFLVAGSLASPPTYPLEDKPPVEYVIGACGSDEFTVIHAVLQEDKDGKQKLIFDYYLQHGLKIVKDTSPDVFDYTPSPKDKDGDIEFTARGKEEDTVLVLKGIIHKDRIAFLMFVPDKLGHVFYGHEGKVSDMLVDVKQNFLICQDFHGADTKDFPAMLADYLSGNFGEAKPDKN